jgi:hypothetical protein
VLMRSARGLKFCCATFCQVMKLCKNDVRMKLCNDIQLYIYIYNVISISVIIYYVICENEFLVLKRKNCTIGPCG